MTDFLQTTVGVKYIRLKKPTNHSPQFNARKSFKTQKVLGGLFFDKYWNLQVLIFIDWTPPLLFHNAGSASAKQTKKLLYIKDALAKYHSGMSSGQSIDPVLLYLFTKVRANMQRGYFILNKALVPVTNLMKIYHRRSLPM